MASFNVNFELSVEDVDLIETALRASKKDLSAQLIGPEPTSDVAALENTVRRINDLLGHLHNQKVFYRPKAGAYIGG